MPKRKTHNTNLLQEINHQLFGRSHRPIKHLGKTLVRGSLNATNAVIDEVLSSVFGVGRTSKRRKRR